MFRLNTVIDFRILWTSTLKDGSKEIEAKENLYNHSVIALNQSGNNEKCFCISLNLDWKTVLEKF